MWSPFHICDDHGLSLLSCATFSRAKAFVSEHFIHVLSMRDGHFKQQWRWILMSFPRWRTIALVCISKKFMPLDSLVALVQESRGSAKDLFKSSSDVVPTTKIDKCTVDDFKAFAVQWLSKSSQHCHSPVLWITVVGLSPTIALVKNIWTKKELQHWWGR